jgi:hypothetical protein
VLSASDKANVDLFVMSKCPDVKDFYNNVFLQLYKDLNSIMDIKVYFIAKVDVTQKYGFKSLHGVTEVEGDLLEACAQNLYPNNNDYFKLLVCVNPQMPYIPRVVQDCANKVGID